jgi:hypothetical protein
VTAPRFAGCRCGHSKEAHSVPSMAPQCTAQKCACLAYRPDVATVPPRPMTTPTVPAPPTVTLVPEPTDGPTLEQVLQAGKRSDLKRTVALAEKVADLLADLRGRLADERRAAEAQRKADAEREAAGAEVARLEAALRVAKAKLRGAPAQAATSTAGTGRSTQDCPTCGLPFSNLGVHRAKKHGHKAGAA